MDMKNIKKKFIFTKKKKLIFLVLILKDNINLIDIKDFLFFI